MAAKKTGKAEAKSVEETLDDALDLELDADVFSEDGPTMDELEAQIMEAADELTKSEAEDKAARDAEARKKAATARKDTAKAEAAAPARKPQQGSAAKPVKAEPSDNPPAPIQKPLRGMSAANDPGRRDHVSALLERKTLDQLTAPGIRDQLRSELRALAEPYLKAGSVKVFLPQYIVQ